jgi:hypothetical protein
MIFIYPIYNHNWRNISTIYIYKTRLASNELKWLGHVERMPNEGEVTRIYKWKPLASRPKRRPKNRLEDDVRTDLEKMRTENWRRNVLDRASWRTIVERTKTQPSNKNTSGSRSG